MIAKIEDGMLFLTPENEQEKTDAHKWAYEIYTHYNELEDFMVWVEEIGGYKEGY